MAENPASENPESPKTQSTPAPKSVDLNVGGNIGGNVVVGDHNYIVNNYYPAVENNTEKHEPDYWALKHPYPMPPNFTGRIAERALLTHWLKEDSENRLFILRALGGFGKSALTWHWLTHDVDIKEYPKVVFWSFYEGDASFEHFIEETLKYLKLEVPHGQRPQVDELLKAMQGQKILLIMDGFERALRAYSSMNAAYQGDESPLPEGEGQGEGALDCVNINAEIFLKGVCSLPKIKSKVLMTTRLTPRAIKPRGEFMLGCREVELTSMQKEDAVAFFRKQGIKGTHAEIETACVSYGYHPLSLRLLAGRILKDFENPADIVVAQKLKIDGDIIQQKHHVLELSYNSLPPHKQKLLSTIACFRSPIELKTVEAIAGDVIGTRYIVSLQNDLHDLVARGLLHFDEKNKKFDLHPIVRRYVYERLTAPDRTAAHTRLRDYFAAVDTPAKPQTLDDLALVIELYYHTVRAGEFETALELFDNRLSAPLHYQFGAYQTKVELLQVLFTDGEDETSRLSENNQAWALNELSGGYAITGQPHLALPLVERKNAIREKIGDKENIASGLVNIATQQFSVGSLRAAESSLRRSLELCKEIQNKFYEAINHQYLGRLLAYRGLWQEAYQELADGQKYMEQIENYDSLCIIHCYQSLRSLLMKETKIAINESQSAMMAWEEDAKNTYPTIRTLIRTLWLLGASYRADGDLNNAEGNLSKAISLCRQINMVDHEADILLGLARLRYDQQNYGEAKSLADEALLISERCGYVLQGADVNLFLAELTLTLDPSPEGRGKAREYAETALKLAYCDGPPFYYKVAYHEAERFLENLK